MVFGTFLEYLLKNQQEASLEAKTLLYRALNKISDDQSKSHIFNLLSLLFDK